MVNLQRTLHSGLNANIEAASSAISSNSPDLYETSAKEVFRITQFESIVKIEQGSSLDALGPIFAENFGLTREWLVNRSQGLTDRYHSVSRRILQKDGRLYERKNEKKIQNCYGNFRKVV